MSHTESIVMDMDQDQDILQLELEYNLVLRLDSVEDLSDHEEEPQPADTLESLVCSSEDLFTDSQLVALVTAPSQDPEGPPLRSVEVEIVNGVSRNWGISERRYSASGINLATIQSGQNR